MTGKGATLLRRLCRAVWRSLFLFRANPPDFRCRFFVVIPSHSILTNFPAMAEAARAKLLAQMRQGEVVRHYETERLRKAGGRIFVSLTLSPQRDGKGQLIGFWTIARDITEQRTGQEALQRSERALADLFEEASVGLVWTTIGGRVLRANRASLEMLECGPGECAGLALGSFHPERRVLARLIHGLTRRETVRNFQTRFRTRKGHQRMRVTIVSGWSHYEANWDAG